MVRRDPAVSLVSKLATLKAAAARGDWVVALRLASRFGQLGAQRGAILTARGAQVRPEFYRELGQDPDALVAAGIAAMKERWRL